MPTSNIFKHKLKITKSCDSNLSEDQHDSQIAKVRQQQMNGSIIQHAEFLPRKVNSPIFPIVRISSQRNLPDISYLHTAGETEYDEDESDTEDLLLPQQLRWINDPSLGLENISNSKPKSPSQFLDVLHDNIGNEGGSQGSPQAAQVKERRKLKNPQRQKLVVQRSPEGIYPIAQQFHTIKSCTLYSKPIKDTKSSSRYQGREGQEPREKGILRGKVKSDLSVNVAPFSVKSFVTKDHYPLSQTRSSVARHRYLKRTSNTFERVNKRQTSQLNDAANLRKAYFTDRQSGKLLDQEKSATLKPGHVNVCKQEPLFQDMKVRKSLSQKTQRVDFKTLRRGSTQHEEILQAQRAKEIRCEMKKKQRQEIYALNKVMTDLENERFTQFMLNNACNDSKDEDEKPDAGTVVPGPRKKMGS